MYKFEVSHAITVLETAHNIINIQKLFKNFKNILDIKNIESNKPQPITYKKHFRLSKYKNEESKYQTIQKLISTTFQLLVSDWITVLRGKKTT